MCEAHRALYVRYIELTIIIIIIALWITVY